jgi:hypothetical protein
MDLARTAYEAYSVTSGGKSLMTGERLPPFDELTPEAVGAWQAAADAVIATHDESTQDANTASQ